MTTRPLYIPALLGALLGLGSLATHSELVVMRASGVSRLRLLRSAGLAGLILMLLMALLGESIAPSAGQYARQLRAEAMHQDLALATGTDVWLKQGEVIVNLRQLSQDFSFGAVALFEVGSDQTLKNMGRAESANIDERQRWILDNYAETRFAEQGVQIAGGVPLKCDEPDDFKTFRIGLFGLDKLDDVDAAVARFEDVIAAVV